MMVIVIKKQKEKICVIKRRPKSNDDKKYLLNSEIIFKSQQRFKIEADNAFTEEINKVTLMMIRDCRLLMELYHTHIVQVLVNSMQKQRC